SGVPREGCYFVGFVVGVLSTLPHICPPCFELDHVPAYWPSKNMTRAVNVPKPGIVSFDGHMTAVSPAHLTGMCRSIGTASPLYSIFAVMVHSSPSPLTARMME